MSESAAGWTKVPNTILRDPTLAIQAKTLYAVLLSYAWQDGQTWVSQDTLSKALGCKPRSIRSWLTTLEHRGLISSESRGVGRSNRYHLRQAPAAVAAPAGKQMPTVQRRRLAANERPRDLDPRDEDSAARVTGSRPARSLADIFTQAATETGSETLAALVARKQGRDG